MNEVKEIMTSKNQLTSIHFVLPGGGVKGCFQAGFLFQLFGKYRERFSISRIDGTSVGALNGYAIAQGNAHLLEHTWENIKTIDDIFTSGISIPYLDSLAKGYRFYSKYALYENIKLQNIITRVENERRCDIAKTSDMSKFNCVVTSVRSGKYKYKNGASEDIDKFVLASASPWIVSPPVEIDKDLYTDGGLLQTIPSDFIGKIGADITLVIGYDLNCEVVDGDEGDNALSYLGRLIDITRLNHHNISQFKSLIDSQSGNVHVIDNPLKIGFIDFNIDEMKRGFQLGKEAAEKFASDILLSEESNILSPQKNKYG